MKVRFLLTNILVIISFVLIFATNTKSESTQSSYDKESVSDTIKYDNQTEINNSNKSSNQNSKSTVAESKSDFKNILLQEITYFVIGLIIGALVVYFYSRHRIHKILSEEKNRYYEMINNKRKCKFFNYIHLVEILKTSKDNKKREINRLSTDQNITLKNMKNEQPMILDGDVSINDKKTHENIKNIDGDEKTNSKEIFWDIAEEEKIKNSEFFFSIPFEDGTFLDLHKSEIKEHNSFYKIKLIGNNIGELHFLSGEYDKTALDDISGYLSPVCAIENIDKRLSAKRIIMKASGEVILSDGVWKINLNKKVKVELI